MFLPPVEPDSSLSSYILSVSMQYSTTICKGKVMYCCYASSVVLSITSIHTECYSSFRLLDLQVARIF